MAGTFCNDSNVHAELDKLLTGKTGQHPVFAEFINSLMTVGLDVEHVASVAQSDSYARSRVTQRTEPCLTLFVATREAFAAMSVSEHDSNWSGDFFMTDEIRSLWTGSCRRHGIAESYFSPNMFVFIYSLQKLLLNRLVRSCKSQIIDRLSRRESAVSSIPAHVFVSSEPAVFIVYSTKRELHFAEQCGALVLLRDAVSSTLADNDQHKCFNRDLVKMTFLDAETHRDSLYGLSRED